MSPKVVILCGGQGTRIRDVSEVLPKPMVPVGGQPILWHIMKLFVHHGFKDFVLCLGYKGWVIKEYFLNYRAMRDDVRLELGRSRIEYLGSAGLDDWTVTLAETGEETMTGGRIRAIRKYVEGDEPWFLTYGDGLADVELGQLLQFHRQHGRVATVSGVFPTGRYGEIRAADGGMVSEFDEKPMEGDALISGGFFVLDGRRVWDFLDGDGQLVFEREPMRRLVAAKQLMVREHRGFWQAMDTLREYLVLNDMWNKGSAPWKVW